MLIASGLVFLDRKSNFPGWWALLPTVGVFLLISAGPKAWFNRHVLSNRMLVWVGLISYPLYLSHWPLLSFARIVEGEIPSQGLRIVCVLVSIVLAWLTYKLIEKPVRYGGYVSAKAIVLCLLMMAIGYFGFYTYQLDGANARNNFEKARDLFMKPAHYIHCSAGPIALSYCSLSSNKAPNYAIFGDSHAAHLFPGIAEIDKINGWLLIGNSSCPPILGIKVTQPVNLPQDCQQRNEEALESILKLQSIRTVVFTFTNSYTSNVAFSAGEKDAHFDDATFKFSRPGHSASQDKLAIFYLGLEMAVTALEQKGKSIIIVIDVPGFPFFARDCLRQSLLFGGNKTCNLSKTAALDSQTNLRILLNKLVTAHSKVRLYDPFNLFCDKESCNFENDGVLLYQDSDHLSLRGSKFLAKDFLNWMSKNQSN